MEEWAGRPSDTVVHVFSKKQIFGIDFLIKVSFREEISPLEAKKWQNQLIHILSIENTLILKRGAIGTLTMDTIKDGQSGMFRIFTRLFTDALITYTLF